MKIKLMLMTCLSSLFLLTSCSNIGGCCGYSYYDYNSQCGAPSCTVNPTMGCYSDPCPGPYDCYTYY